MLLAAVLKKMRWEDICLLYDMKLKAKLCCLRYNSMKKYEGGGVGKDVAASFLR
jgi:hypothetical protein